MRLNESIRLPQAPESIYDRQLSQELYGQLRDICKKVNQLASGQIIGNDFTATVAPTTGVFFLGDQVKNSAPTVLGAAGRRYVVVGWICTSSGSPGIFNELRMLTGT